MLASRGFVTAALLVLIALSCLAVTRRLERERRFIARLRARHAASSPRALRRAELDPDEQDTARDLIGAGVVRLSGGEYFLEPRVLAGFRRKRLRLALTGALGALGLALLVTLLILRR
jgi:hypothetical protein